MAASASPRLSAPLTNCFWQIIWNTPSVPGSASPPWNAKYGSCMLPQSPENLVEGKSRCAFFGGSAGHSDLWVATVAINGVQWARIDLFSGSEGPSPRLYPLMRALSPTRLLLVGGVELETPWAAKTDAFTGQIDFESATVRWSRVALRGASENFAYASPEHAPLATTSVFMRSLEGALIIAMPLRTPLLSAVRGITEPGAQRHALVVTLFDDSLAAETGVVAASTHVSEYSSAAPFSETSWPVTEMQGLRLAEMADGFAFGMAVPRSRESASVISPSCWILRISVPRALSETQTPSISYSWASMSGAPYAPALRTGAAIFSAQTNEAAGLVCVCGGAAIWESPGQLAVWKRAPLPLHTASLATTRSSSAARFMWQRPLVRQTPPFGDTNTAPPWDADVAPAEVISMRRIEGGNQTFAFLHFGGSWRDAETNATILTMLTVPLAAIAAPETMYNSFLIQAGESGDQQTARAIPNVAGISTFGGPLGWFDY